MTENKENETSNATGNKLIKRSFECLLAPGLSGVLGLALLCVCSAGSPLFAVEIPLGILLLAATCVAPIFSLLGVILAALALFLSKNRREDVARCAIAVALNAICGLAAFPWMVLTMGAMHRPA